MSPSQETAGGEAGNHTKQYGIIGAKKQPEKPEEKSGKERDLQSCGTGLTENDRVNSQPGFFAPGTLKSGSPDTKNPGGIPGEVTLERQGDSTGSRMVPG
ncbi:MAG: hypothetical protein HQL99_03350 [Magnetococcales bacterium]|nr:hypothetical protein [Magnetococcales bacterium]